MRLLRICLLLSIFPLSIWAQTDKIAEDILHKSAQVIYSDLSKGEKQALFFTQNQANKTNTVAAFLILADAAYLKGDYASVMRNLYAADTIRLERNEMAFEIRKKLSLARYYRLFGFGELAKQKRAEVFQLLRVGSFKRDELWMRYYFENALAARTKANGIKDLMQAETLAHLKNLPVKSPLQYELLLHYAATFRESHTFEIAAEANGQILSEDASNVFMGRALLELALWNTANGKKPILPLLEADALLDDHTDVQTQRAVAQLLSEDFLQKEDVQSYKKYVEKYQKLNVQLTHSLKEARDVVIVHLEAEKKIESADMNYYPFAAGVLLLLLCGGIYFYVKAKKDYKKFLAVVDKANQPEPVPVRQMAIPQKTEEALLEKLAKFEKSNRFTNPNLTIITLAKSLDTNTKYLSEVINRNKDANFNQYINELRIKYIIGKMKEDPKYLNYKVYYLAKECGFASQSTFSTVFRASTGISPLSFIKFLKNESKTVS